MSLSNDSIAEGADLNLRSVRTEMQSFLLRLHAIIQSKSKGIQWSNAGSAFIITDEHLFRTEILDQHFPRFKDISSFGNYLVHKVRCKLEYRTVRSKLLFIVLIIVILIIVIVLIITVILIMIITVIVVITCYSTGLNVSKIPVSWNSDTLTFTRIIPN